MQQVDDQAAQRHGFGAPHDQRAQRCQRHHLAVVPVFRGVALCILQELGPLGFEVGRQYVQALSVFHAQCCNQRRPFKARVQAQARYFYLEARGKFRKRLQGIHLEPCRNADPGRALCSGARRIVLRPGYRHEVVAQAAAAEGALECCVVPHLLYCQHVIIEHAKPVAQPGELAIKLRLAVGVLVLVEQAARIDQVEHIAGGHHQSGQGLGEVVGAHRPQHRTGNCSGLGRRSEDLQRVA